MSDERESQTTERARALFEESVERLDARTRSRLTQARHAALDEFHRRAQRPRLTLWAPAAGLAAAAALVLLLRSEPSGEPGFEAAPFEELDLIAEGGELDMLQDVAFYAWLAQAPPEDASGG